VQKTKEPHLKSPYQNIIKMAKILYVEDEVFLAKIVKESLERNSHEVAHVGDGAQAQNTFIEFNPEICVLDIMLPNYNGYEIAEQIRKINSEIPIIFLTAKSQTEDLVQGFQSGGNDYIKKPFSMEELLVRIENLIHLSKGKTNQKNKNEEIQIGSYLFYPLKQQLILKGEIKSLSHKESMILDLLSQNTNSSIDRKDILLKVWGDDSYFNSRNLDVYIRKLRKYLASDEKVEIVTLKGIGYSFIVG